MLKQTEAALQRACNRHAKAKGCRPVKLSHGDAGMPDYGYLLPTGNRIWLVEFKTVDGDLSPRQMIVHSELEKAGHRVSVVRDIVAFRVMLKNRLTL